MTDPTRRPNPGPAKPSAAKPAGQPAQQPRPAQAQQRPAQPAAARPAQPAQRQPAPAPAPAPVAAPPRRAPPAKRGGGPADEPLDATTKNGLIAAGVLVVIASVVWIVIQGKKDEEDAKERERVERIETFIKEVEATDLTSIEACEKTIKRIETETDKWKETNIEGRALSMKSKCTGAIAEIQRRAEFNRIYKAAEGVMTNPGSLSSDELVKLRQQLGDIESQAEGIDPAYPKKIVEMKNAIDQILVGKMKDEAKAFVALGTTTARQGIAKYAAAEDYVRKAVEEANRVKNKPLEDKYTEIYKDLLRESDEYSARVINEEFINGTQWKDLLGGEMQGRWAKTTNIPGFSCRVENGVLTISPPDKNSGQKGVASILDQPSDNLRHFAIEMEFKVEGYAKMFFHVNPPPNPPDSRQAVQFDLEQKDGGFQKDQAYTMVTSYIGSQLQVTFPNSEMQAYSESVSYARRRKGGIAFVIQEGARLRITRMRIKEFR